jgi:hypothetical protein
MQNYYPHINHKEIKWLGWEDLLKHLLGSERHLIVNRIWL